MTEPVHVFNREAMATWFQVRIAGEERSYAAQAARTAFDRLDHLESLLSRFRENSEISQLNLLNPGEQMRVSEPTFACLEIAARMETATGRAFCISPAAMKAQAELPTWTLSPPDFSVRCESGRLEFDLGAIGKGFALDRMAEELAEWECPSFLLVAGGSSILAGAAPPGTAGWSSGLGDDNSPHRFLLTHCSLSGSGLAVKGNHIFDPRTGLAVENHSRMWALADSAAESDALSTACMVLTEPAIAECLKENARWLVLTERDGTVVHFGQRPLPLADLGKQETG